MATNANVSELVSASSFADSSCTSAHTPSDDGIMSMQFRPMSSSNVQSVGNEALRYYVNSVVIPLLLTLGAVGNSVSLLLLAYRPCRRFPPPTRPLITAVGLMVHGQWQPPGHRKISLQPLERAAMVGLGALAVSDLAFCLVGIPAGLLALAGIRPGDGSTTTRIAQEYTVYSLPLHNMFLFSSTWITVFVAVERFFAVINPLRARWYLKVRSFFSRQPLYDQIQNKQCLNL
jgi:hypothetical protein